ncbi:SbcC/MukB-like Walker B domain-containing protein [Marinicrinis sediminis]|uniref:Nuclease SbcCD subunit C n=1 Tax=Marinicrinis sediminis TaxID=1652465 RepID=A0ABW5RCH5_9BACL
MRPVYLKLSGLQSYRQEQEIDFSMLCDGGVFGIFGPTGSGKSTILDAMTLALYGKVERAINGTQGIMNQNEKKLMVAFTFELASASGRDRYTIERQFKRTGEISVSTVLCRLIRVTANREEVLADKQTEVNAEIEQLIGLTMHDFTRAVVLPQGKFAEFLSLKGSERRQMLQRLFGLERYGDQLQQRLSQRLKDSDARRKQWTARLEGLGDASAVAVEAAREQLRTEERALTQVRTELKRLETDIEEKREVRRLQQERDVHIQSLEQLKQQKPEMDTRKRRYQLGLEARQLEPAWRQWKEEQERHKEAELRLQQRQERQEKLHRQLEEFEGKAKRVRQHWTEQEPLMTAKMNTFQQAIKLESEIADMQEQIAKWTEDQTVWQNRQRMQQQEMDKAAEMLRRATERQEQIKQELVQTRMPQDEKQRLKQAWQQMKEMQPLQQQVEAWGQTVEQAQQACRKQEQACESQGRLLGETFAQVVRQSAELAECRDQGLLLVQTTALSVTRFNEWIGMQKQFREERGLQAAAVQLAERLKQDEACPVCGSIHHPQPATEEEQEEVPATGEQMDAAYQALRELEHVQHQLQTQVEAWQAKLDEVHNLAARLNQASSALGEQADAEDQTDRTPAWLASIREAAANRIPASLQEKDHLETVGAMYGWGSWMDRLAHLQNEMTQCMQRPAAQLSVKSLEAELRTYEQSVWQLTQFTDKLTADQMKARELDRQLLEAKEQWRTRFVDDELETIDQAHRKCEEREQQAEELQQRLDKSYSYIEEQRKHSEQATQALHQLERQLIETETTLSNRKELSSEKKERLHALCGDRDPQEAYQELHEQYQRMKQENEQVAQSLEHHKLEMAKVSTEVQHADAACKEYATRAEKLTQQWQQRLTESCFETEEDMIDAMADPSELSVWSEELERYEARWQQVEGLLSELLQQLQARSIDETAWTELLDEAKAVKARFEEGLQKQGKAARDYEELTRRNESWAEAHQQLEAEEQAWRQLTALQSVFRGNGFVEFIAEEQMMHVSRAASERLGELTRQRYAIEVDSSGGFVMRDQTNGGVKRPVSSLSGGETFLTSLALALALSAQIQLGGKYPLEFFFLDEGFGTLDGDLLETVVDALEKLQLQKVSVGVISHVPEMRARLARKLVVEPAAQTGQGSRVYLEQM